MRIKIDLQSKAPEQFVALQYVQQDELQRLKDEARKMIGNYDELPIGVYIHLLNGDLDAVGIDKDRPTVGQYLWTLGLKDHVDAFVEAGEKMKIPQNEMEKRAGEGCPTMDFEESVLIFCREYFGLHNFDIDSIKVWEYMLARKDAFAKRLFQHNYDKLMTKKYAKK